MPLGPMPSCGEVVCSHNLLISVDATLVLMLRCQSFTYLILKGFCINPNPQTLNPFVLEGMQTQKAEVCIDNWPKPEQP